jgi:uncharacterized membrane protein YeaQ/YmgE (transglycosylase-associated protein family)
MPTQMSPEISGFDCVGFFSTSTVSRRRFNMLIGVVGWIVLGIIAGFIASKVVSLRGDDPKMGICLAAFGALMGGWLYSLISGAAVTSFNPRSLMFAALAAGVVLVAFHAWRWKAA